MTAPAQGSLLVLRVSVTNGVVDLVTDGPDGITYEGAMATLRQRDVLKGRRWDRDVEGYQGPRTAVPFHAVTCVTEHVHRQP